MTKIRAPLSFALAIQTVCELVGLDAASRLTGKGNWTVRAWADNDKKGSPSLDQAIALDRAFVQAGGGYAPILESYARQMGMELTPSVACLDGLATDIAAVSKETADAITTSIMVMRPGASPTAVHHAIAEAEEAGVSMTRLLARLTSFLPSNGAVRNSTGER